MTQEMKSLLAKLDNWRLPPDPWSGVSEPNPLAQQAAAALRTQAAEIDALAKRLGEQGLEIIEYAKSLATTGARGALRGGAGGPPAVTAPAPQAILPCPCGGKATLVCDDFINGRLIDDPDYYVECNGKWCGASTPPTKQPDEAIARWNRMVGP